MLSPLQHMALSVAARLPPVFCGAALDSLPSVLVATSPNIGSSIADGRLKLFPAMVPALPLILAKKKERQQCRPTVAMVTTDEESWFQQMKTPVLAIAMAGCSISWRFILAEKREFKFLTTLC